MQRKVQLFDIVARKWLGTLNVKQGVQCIKCTKGYIIVAMAFSQNIQVWDFRNRIHIATLHGHSNNVNKLAACGDKMAASDTNSVCVWSLVSFERLCVVDVVDDITALAVNGEWLVVASGEPRKQQKSVVKWWRVDEGRREAFLAGGNPARWPLNVRDCNVRGVKGFLYIFFFFDFY
jgi:WD40 repeat protein